MVSASLGYTSCLIHTGWVTVSGVMYKFAFGMRMFWQLGRRGEIQLPTTWLWGIQQQDPVHIEETACSLGLGSLPQHTGQLTNWSVADTEDARMVCTTRLLVSNSS